MAYNFLGLVNDINERVNEVPLTSGNFSTATGFYSTAKQAVNSSIRRLNRENFLWPFNYSLQEDTLTAGTMRYSYPATAKVVDFNTFRIKRDGTIGNDSQRLFILDYEEYLDRYIDDEYNTSDTGIRGMPKAVARTPGLEYVIAPAPDEAYKINYEIYTLPTDLSAYTDAPSATEDFRYVIIEGAMYHVYLFRNDYDAADRANRQFQDGLKDMRAIYSNRFEYLRDTRVMHNRAGVSAIEVS